MKKFRGIILMNISVIFAMAETIYFGNNWHPASTAELICDRISILIFIVGLITAFLIDPESEE